VNEQPRLLAGAVVGAFIGAAAVYFFFTEPGRAAFARLNPALDSLSIEVSRFRRAVERVGRLTGESVGAVQDLQAARQQGYSSDIAH